MTGCTVSDLSVALASAMDLPAEFSSALVAVLSESGAAGSLDERATSRDAAAMLIALLTRDSPLRAAASLDWFGGFEFHGMAGSVSGATGFAARLFTMRPEEDEQYRGTFLDALSRIIDQKRGGDRFLLSPTLSVFEIVLARGSVSDCAHIYFRETPTDPQPVIFGYLPKTWRVQSQARSPLFGGGGVSGEVINVIAELLGPLPSAAEGSIAHG